MNRVAFLAAWLMVGFAGLSATLVAIFAQDFATWSFPAGLLVLGVVLLVVADPRDGDHGA